MSVKKDVFIWPTWLKSYNNIKTILKRIHISVIEQTSRGERLRHSLRLLMIVLSANRSCRRYMVNSIIAQLLFLDAR